MDCLGRLTVGQALGKLEQGHESKPPGCLRRAAASGEQTREPAVIEYRAQLVAQAHVAVALGKRSAGDTHRLLGNSWTDLRAEGHDAELPQDAASSRPTSTSPLGSCLYLTAPNSPAVSKVAKSPCLRSPPASRPVPAITPSKSRPPRCNVLGPSAQRVIGIRLR